ncbi:hypothetical protein JHK85_025137 [Glycine max]|nr:hypothetical protein JHK85_025137 [Glycine max]
MFFQEEDKARLVQETGLQLKQINNWFINQRKRNWHTNPSSSSGSKSKRKRDTTKEVKERHLTTMTEAHEREEALRLTINVYISKDAPCYNYYDRPALSKRIWFFA